MSFSDTPKNSLQRKEMKISKTALVCASTHEHSFCFLFFCLLLSTMMHHPRQHGSNANANHARLMRPPYVDPNTNIIYDTDNPEYEGWLTKQSMWLKVSYCTIVSFYDTSSHSHTMLLSFLRSGDVVTLFSRAVNCFLPRMSIRLRTA